MLLRRLSQLEELWERCRQNHTFLQSSSPPPADDHDDQFDVYDLDSFARKEESYEEVIDFILSDLPDESHNGTPQGNQEKPDVARHPKLLTISMPTFSGMCSECLAFRDLFTSLVIKNDSLSDAKRLHYLQASLTGDAKVVAQNKIGTADNFQTIWHNLETRYHNCKSSMNDYLRKIVEMPDITSDWLNSLQKMHNGIMTVTTALRNLNRPIDEGNDLFVFLLLNKSDKTLRDR